MVSAPSYLQHSQKQVYKLIGKCQTQSRVVKHALAFPVSQEEGRIGSSNENSRNMEETIGGRGWTDVVKMKQMERSVGRSDRTRGRDGAEIRVWKIARRLQQAKVVTKAGLWSTTCCACSVWKCIVSTEHSENGEPNGVSCIPLQHVDPSTPLGNESLCQSLDEMSLSVCWHSSSHIRPLRFGPTTKRTQYR